MLRATPLTYVSVGEPCLTGTPQQHTHVSLKGWFLGLDFGCGKENNCSYLMGKNSSVKTWSLHWGGGGTGRQWQGESRSCFDKLKVAGVYFLTLLHNHFTCSFFPSPPHMRRTLVLPFLKNRWRLLVATALLRDSSLFGTYMDLVNIFLLWTGSSLKFKFPVPSSKKSSACFPPPSPLLPNNHALEVK